VLHDRITDDDTVQHGVLHCSCAAELLRIIRSDYLNELVDIEVNGRHLQPTKCLPWCVHVCVHVTVLVQPSSSDGHVVRIKLGPWLF